MWLPLERNVASLASRIDRVTYGSYSEIIVRVNACLEAGRSALYDNPEGQEGRLAKGDSRRLGSCEKSPLISQGICRQARGQIHSKPARPRLRT